MYMRVFREGEEKRERDRDKDRHRPTKREKERSDAKVSCMVVKKANVLLKCFSKLTISSGGSRVCRKGAKMARGPESPCGSSSQGLVDFL